MADQKRVHFRTTPAHNVVEPNPAHSGSSPPHQRQHQHQQEHTTFFVRLGVAVAVAMAAVLGAYEHGFMGMVRAVDQLKCNIERVGILQLRTRPTATQQPFVVFNSDNEDFRHFFSAELLVRRFGSTPLFRITTAEGDQWLDCEPQLPTTLSHSFRAESAQPHEKLRWILSDNGSIFATNPSLAKLFRLHTQLAAKQNNSPKLHMLFGRNGTGTTFQPHAFDWLEVLSGEIVVLMAPPSRPPQVNSLLPPADWLPNTIPSTQLARLKSCSLHGGEAVWIPPNWYIALLAMSDHAVAIAAQADAEESQPIVGLALHQLRNTASRGSKLIEQSVEMALHSFPGDQKVLTESGFALMAANDFAKASALFRQVLAQAEQEHVGSLPAVVGLALALHSLGFEGKGKVQWELAKRVLGEDELSCCACGWLLVARQTFQHSPDSFV